MFMNTTDTKLTPVYYKGGGPDQQLSRRTSTHQATLRYSHCDAACKMRLPVKRRRAHDTRGAAVIG
jgi:hypothetical protein